MVACGPSRSDRERLERAEAIVREHPDSALVVRDSITPRALANSDFRARAAIVEAEAAYQTSRRLPSDSLLDEAVERYISGPDTPRRLRALYLRGYHNYLAERYGNAIVDYLAAEQTAKALADSISLGLIYRALGDIYTDTYDWNSALEAYKSSDLYIGKNEKYGLWAKYDVAKAYFLMGMNDSCIAQADALIHSAQAISDSNLIAFATRVKGKALVESHRYEDAISSYEWIINHSSLELDDTDCLYLGTSYLNTGNEQKAQECKNLIGELTGEHYTWIDFFTDDKSDNAHSFIINEYNDQHKHIESLTQQKLHQLTQDYLILQAEVATQRADNLQRQRFIYVALALSLIIIFLLIIYVRSKSLKQRLAERILVADELSCKLQFLTSLLEIKNTENSVLKQETTEKSLLVAKLRNQLQSQTALLEVSGIENSALKQEMKNFFVDRLDFLKNFAEKYYELKGNKNVQAKMTEQLLELLSSFKPDGPEIKKLEDAVNARFDNIISRLRKNIPALNDGEIALFIYYVLQFSPRCISLFFDCRTSAVYNRKKVLKTKIKQSDVPDVADYLIFLD